MLQAVLSVGMRLPAVAGKFIAILALAAESGPAEVGKFTLFFSAINVLVVAVGFDFYQFVFREVIAKRSPSGRLRVLLGHQGFNLIAYVLALLAVVIFAVCFGETFSGFPFGWFTAILITDHAAQDLSRFFIVLSRPVHANIVYAAKTGAWAWIVVGLSAFQESALTAQSFYPFWLAANVLAIGYGVAVLFVSFRGARFSLPSRYPRWLARGVRISSVFFATSVAVSALGVLDRFVVAAGRSIADAGFYAFWQSVASLIPIVVYAVAGMHFLPRLIAAYQKGSPSEFHGIHHSFLARSLGVSGFFAVILVLASFIVPDMLGRQDRDAPVTLVALLAFTAAMTSLWQVPYQVLYSGHRDAFLAKAIITATSVSFVANVLLIESFGVMGAAIIGALTNLGLYLVLSGEARRVLASLCRDVTTEHRTG